MPPMRRLFASDNLMLGAS